MLASFFFAFLAGFATVYAEPLIEAAIGKIVDFDVKLGALEFRVLTFGLMMVLASIVISMVGADSSAFLLSAGGLIGFFAKRLYGFLKDPDAALGRDQDDWAGDVHAPGATAGTAGTTGTATQEDEEILRAAAAAAAATQAETPVVPAEPQAEPQAELGANPVPNPEAGPADDTTGEKDKTS